jgi:hypothetical protein
VFVRGLEGTGGKPHGHISLFGDQPSERVPGPVHALWMSDHAGIVATILTPAGQ